MVICAAAFVPHKNNFWLGGEGQKIAFTRCGGKGVAQKNTYKRVYNDDGSYTHPKISKNQLRKRETNILRIGRLPGARR